MATITGKWRWNDTIEGTEEIKDLRINIRFDSGGGNFHGIDVDKGVDGVYRLRYMPYTGSAPIVFQSTWNPPDSTMLLSLEEYRIIDFRRDILSIDQDAYEFIVANAEPFYDIADKLRRVYHNVDEVYYSGKSAGREAGKREGYEVGKGDGLIEGYNNGYQDGLVSSDGYEKGKQAEHDAFWDVYQENGSASREYEYAFRDGFNDENFKPKYDFHIKGNYSGSGMFYRSKITDIVACLNRQGVVWECSQALRLDSTFQQTLTKTVPIIDASVLTRLQQTFNNATNLQEIVINNLQAACTFSIAFNSCSALTTVSITGEIGNDINFQWSTKLTRASIENIINHLSNTASGKKLTLSKTATENAFPVWDDWGALVMAHQNWTLALV